MITEGYEDPAMEGAKITFSCRGGLSLIGPNLTMCMGNGEWEPDLGEVACTGTCVHAVFANICIYIDIPCRYTNKQDR